MKKIIFWLIVIAALLWGGRLFYFACLQSPLAGPSVAVTIQAGDNMSLVAQRLADKKIINSAFYYRLYGWFDAAAQRPKAGDFHLRPGTSYHELARQIALGPAFNEIKLTIIEGWTVDDEIKYLHDEQGVAATATQALVGQSVDAQPFDPSLRDQFKFLGDLPKKRSLDGYLFPETYRVYEEQLPDSLVNKQLNEFEQKFGSVHITAASAPLKTLDEVVILASMVEKEVRSPGDRKIVAGIFLRRLKEGMGLQSDATLTYALGAGSRATSDELKSTSPYNTYKWRGLPPGPICNPAESAIQAVLDPAPTSYRYFLTDKDGKVLYASTLEEHAANRRKAGY